MGTRANGIFESLPILAAAFGRREGIKVEIGGNTAYTDGKIIRLPSLPLDCDDELAVKAFGYLYHESGHIEFTDINQFRGTDVASDPLLKFMLNAIEDVRMEDMRNATYPGSAKALADLVATLAKDGAFGTPELIAAAEPHDVLTHACLTHLRSDYLEQPCEEQAQAWMNRAEQLLGTPGMVRFKALMNQVANLDTTADALALARRIRTMIEEVANEPPPEEPANADSTDGSDGAEGAGGEAGATGNDSNPGDTPGDGDNGGAAGDGGDAQGQGSADASAGSAGASAGHGGDQQPDREALKKVLGAGAGDFAPTDLGDIAGKALEEKAAQAMAEDQSANPGSGSIARQLNVSKSTVGGQGELLEVQAASQQLRTKLAAAMDAEARVKVTHRRQGNRLDGNVVHRLFTGDTRVFRRKEATRKVNTAVEILLDRSRSMAGGQIEVARKAALAAAMGIAQIHGCKVAAAAFPDVVVLKDFDDTPRGSAGRFVIDATGTTPMGEAMIWAAGQLLGRREERKMLIVATDGDPNNRELVARVVRKYVASGVEVIGVGIQTEAVKGLFPTAVVIQTVDELAAALFSVVKTKLRRVA